MVAGLPKVAGQCVLHTALPPHSGFHSISRLSRVHDVRTSAETEAAYVWHPLRVVQTNRPPRRSAASAQAA